MRQALFMKNEISSEPPAQVLSLEPQVWSRRSGAHCGLCEPTSFRGHILKAIADGRKWNERPTTLALATAGASARGRIWQWNAETPGLFASKCTLIADLGGTSSAWRKAPFSRFPSISTSSETVGNGGRALGNRPGAGFFPCPKKEKLSVLQNHSESQKIL